LSIDYTTAVQMVIFKFTLYGVAQKVFLPIYYRSNAVPDV